MKSSSKVYNSQIQTSDFTNTQDFTRVHNLFTIGRATCSVEKQDIEMYFNTFWSIGVRLANKNFAPMVI